MSKQMTLGTGFEKYSKATCRENFLTEMGHVVPWKDLCALIARCIRKPVMGARRRSWR